MVSPAYRAALSAPTDDEPVTEADSAAIARAHDELIDQLWGALPPEAVQVAE